MNDSLKNVSTDTVVVERVIQDPATRHYMEILEKTNEQLSISLNPYGIFIAALGLLFTALALMAIYINWKQSRDFKDTLDASITKYEKMIQDFLTHRKVDMETILENFKKSLFEHVEASMNATGSSEDEVQKLKKVNKILLSFIEATNKITICAKHGQLHGLYEVCDKCAEEANKQ